MKNLLVTKGYLLWKFDINTFDEIIILINEFGNIITCYSLGTKKINSKNARSLNYGNYIEFEIFYSQRKLSKLKSCLTLTNEGIEFENCLSLLIINEIIFKFKIDNLKFFNLYQEILLNIKIKINEYQIILYELIKIIKILKINNIFSCSICNLKTTNLYLNKISNKLYCQKHKNNKQDQLIKKEYLNLLTDLFNIEFYIDYLNNLNIEKLKDLITLTNLLLYNFNNIHINYLKHI